MGNDGINYFSDTYGNVLALNSSGNSVFTSPIEHGNLGHTQKLLGLSSAKRLVVQNANGISFVNINSSGLSDSWARRGRDQTRAGRNLGIVTPTHRWITLSGAVKNMTLPEKPLTDYYVRVSVNGTNQCDARVVQVASNVNYSCRIETTSTDAFTATIEARENYYASVPALSVTQSVPTAAFNTVTNITQDLEIHPTMMRLTGTIRDAAGVPLVNQSANLYLSGWNNYYVTTNAQGQYSIVDFVNPIVHTATLNSSDANNNNYSKTFDPFTPTTNTLTEKTFDFQFDADGELTVSGVLRDHLNNVVPNTYVNIYFSGASNQSGSIATDANGSYTFSKHVKPGSYMITVGSRDRANQYKTVSLSNISVVASATVSQTLDLKFDPVGEVIVKGTVKNADGTPGSSRYVNFYGLPYTNGSYVYTTDGTFEYHQWVAINNYTVYATTNDPYNFAVKSQTVTVTADPNTATTVNLELQDPQTAALVVNGQVTDSGGYAYINKYVSLELKSGTQVYTQGASTDSSGSFAATFRTLEGTHSLKVSVDDPNGVTNTSQINDIVLSASAPVTKTVNIELAQTGTLELHGQVLNVDGTPYLGSYYYNPLSITLSSTNYSSKNLGAYTNAQGQYTLTVQVPVGVYSIEVTPTGNATKQVSSSQNVTISIGATTQQTLDLSFRSATVTGVVRDDAGQPIAGVSVYGSSNTNPCFPCSVTTDASGVYVLKYEVAIDAVHFDETINVSKSLDYNLYTQATSAIARDLTAGNAVISQDITLPTKLKTLTVSGTVLDANGTVAAGINVYGGYMTDMTCAVCTVVSDAQGHYQLEFGMLASPSNPTTVQFVPYVSSASGYYNENFTFPIALTSDVQSATQDLHLNTTPVQLEITGKVLLQTVPQAGVNVSFDDLGGGVCTVCSATTDATGLYRLVLELPIGMPSVSYTLKAGAANQLFPWSESLDWTKPNAVVHDLELTP